MDYQGGIKKMISGKLHDLDSQEILTLSSAIRSIECGGSCGCFKVKKDVLETAMDKVTAYIEKQPEEQETEWYNMFRNIAEKYGLVDKAEFYANKSGLDMWKDFYDKHMLFFDIP